MAQLQRKEPGLKFGARGYEEPTLVFYAGGNVEMFGTVDKMLAAVPFGKEGESGFTAPADEHYVIAADDRTIEELDKRHVAYYSYMSLPRVAGVNIATLRPVGVTLITNVGPGTEVGTAASEPATKGVENEGGGRINGAATRVGG
jgi:hypothetical protein